MPTFKKLKEKFITAKHALGVFEAQQKSTTKFFYTVYENCIISGDFNIRSNNPDYQNVKNMFRSDIRDTFVDVNGKTAPTYALLHNDINDKNNEIQDLQKEK